MNELTKAEQDYCEKRAKQYLTHEPDGQYKDIHLALLKALYTISCRDETIRCRDEEIESLKRAK